MLLKPKVEPAVNLLSSLKVAALKSPVLVGGISVEEKRGARLSTNLICEADG
jgi:hypothetical protein